MGKNLNVAALLGLVLPVFLAGASFASPGAVDWGRDGWRLLGGSVALFLAMGWSLSLVGGRRAAGRFMAAAFLLSWLAETLGIHCGWPFGWAYRYHGDLRPVLPGGVPLFIPMAWASLSGTSALLLEGLGISRPDGRRSAARVAAKSALAAVGVVACDLALDPIAVSVGLWTWETPGPYFGIPLLNFSGWWGVAWVIFLVGYGGIGLDRKQRGGLPIRYDLAGGAVNGSLLILLVGASIHRVGSPWPAIWAGVALAPLVAVWFRELRRKVLAYRCERLASGGASACA